jgi:hypothetical protein
VGYSSHDPAEIQKQIDEAKSLGISGFVVDWYGYRDPFNERTYALVQAAAAEQNFHVAMLYDETDREDGATDVAIEEFKLFHDTYLSANATGHEAYLTYNGRPVIFIFPKSGHTDWNRVRAEVNKWPQPPLLIYEDQPGPFPNAFDGFYPWINPGNNSWAADGSNWGAQYLEDFYRSMQSKYSDKIPVGGAWAEFDDSKASWGLNRHINARCGQTLADTLKTARQFYPPENPLPFLLIETWNDYEEGSAIERGIPNCNGGTQPISLH